MRGRDEGRGHKYMDDKYIAARIDFKELDHLLRHPGFRATVTHCTRVFASPSPSPICLDDGREQLHEHHESAEPVRTALALTREQRGRRALTAARESPRTACRFTAPANRPHGSAACIARQVFQPSSSASCGFHGARSKGGQAFLLRHDLAGRENSIGELAPRLGDFALEPGNLFSARARPPCSISTLSISRSRHQPRIGTVRTRQGVD